MLINMYFLNVAQPKRRRGPAKGLRLAAVYAANGYRPVPIEFDWVEGTLSPIGPNSSLLPRFVSSHIAHTIPPNFNNWDEVPDNYK